MVKIHYKRRTVTYIYTTNKRTSVHMMCLNHKISTNMFRPAFRPPSGWHSYTRIQKYNLVNKAKLVSHRYSYFSWWWAHSCPKHVENRNKYTKENCAPSWLYVQDYTESHGQQNIKKKIQKYKFGFPRHRRSMIIKITICVKSIKVM